jgi:organic radical activating enzyme
MHIIPDEDPGDPRVFIPNIEFYITNVCNLNCADCNRFNDYNFSGTQRWSDYESVYARWASSVRLQKITILGGEPLLNPTILDWIDGINRLWNKRVQILTNGTRLNRIPGLYDRLTTSPDLKLPRVRNYVGVSLHNANDRERLFEEIKKFLKGKIKYYHISDPANKNNVLTQGATHIFIDSNDVQIPVWEYTSFYHAAVHRNSAGNLTLYNNDPIATHNECGFVQYKSYHFIKGKLYKCGPVALFPEFDQQHHLDISEQDRELVNSYRALTVEDFESRGSQCIAELDQPIPQCKFCSMSAEHEIKIPLQAVSKKRGSTSGFD